MTEGDRPTPAEIDQVARFNYERSGPIPTPWLLAKFTEESDFTELGRRLIQLLRFEDDDD